MDETPFQPRRRQPRDYALVLLQGFGMGAADVVPGVSGGTIAFITGIYEELLNSIRMVRQPVFFRAVLGLRIKEALSLINQIANCYIQPYHIAMLEDRLSEEKLARIIDTLFAGLSGVDGGAKGVAGLRAAK